MSDTPPAEDAQLLARVTVLELVVGLMIRDSMLKSGKGPQDILGFGEIVKKLLEGRTHRRGQLTSNFVMPRGRVREVGSRQEARRRGQGQLH
jgi:hypothetical protein